MRRAFRFGVGGQHVEREVDDEIAFHIGMRERDLVACGVPPEEARREALRQFGDVGTVRDSCVTLDHERERAMQRADLRDEFTQDVRYALRMLRRAPAFTAVVVLTLALGIGANTSIFTLVDAVVLRHIAVRNPAELVALGNTARTGGLSMGSYSTGLYSYPLYRDLQERNAFLSGLVASGRTPRMDVILASGDAVQHPRTRFVSANFFGVLGIGAAAGRVLDATRDDAIGASPVVVISDAYWARQFDRSPEIIGRKITVNDAGFTIVGVAERGFDGEIVGQTLDMWIPVSMQNVVMPHQQMLSERTSNFLLLLGRLKPGVSYRQAHDGLTTLVRQILVENATPDNPADALRQTSVPISRGANGFSRVRMMYAVPLYTLMAGVALLLLIICANVANLLLARAVARGREMGIRLAIGARQSRIVRQLLTECAVLAVLSGGAGLLVSWWGSRLLLRLASNGSSVIPLDLSLNLPVLAFTAGISVLAVGVFGLVPALRASRIDLSATMRAQGRSVVHGGMRRGGPGGGRALIVGQVAVSLVLLVGAGLLVRSLRSLQGLDTGVDRDHLVVASLNTLDRGYRGERLRALIQNLSERFARVPGVMAVTYSSNGIFSGVDNNGTLSIPGFVANRSEDTVASFDVVGPGYMHAVGARLLEGRDFTESDERRSEPVAIVNATMARFFWPGESAVGKTVRLDSITMRVVGIIADVPYHDLTEKPERRLYSPYLFNAVGDEPGSLSFEIRTGGDPAVAIPYIRKAIKDADPMLSTDWVESLSAMMRSSISQERLVARLATGFGVLALLLAAIGLYGVLTYAVTRRTNEIGLRVALGAQQRDVMAMVVRDALKLVLVGIALGIPLALGATRFLRNQLHGVEPADPFAIGVALGVLTLCAVLAALLPARRAANLDPLSALRSD